MEAGFSLYHDYMLSHPTYSRTHVLGLYSNWSQLGKLWSTCRGSRIFWQWGRSANMQKGQSANPFFWRKRSWHGTLHVTRTKQPSRLLCCVPLPERFRRRKEGGGPLLIRQHASIKRRRESLSLSSNRGREGYEIKA